MHGIRCCVLDQTAWCSGGDPSSPRRMYSWTGPGSAWTNHMDLPGDMFFHSMVCDQTHNAIWALAGFNNNAVYRYSVESELWQTMPSLPDSRVWTQSVLCNNRQVLIMPGGYLLGSSISTILLTSTVTGQTIQSNITLPKPVFIHVSACVSPP